MFQTKQKFKFLIVSLALIGLKRGVELSQNLVVYVATPIYEKKSLCKQGGEP